MFEIIQKILKFFEGNPQSHLEAYIISKNPTNCAEVEHWAKVYSQHNTSWKGL